MKNRSAPALFPAPYCKFELNSDAVPVTSPSTRRSAKNPIRHLRQCSRRTDEHSGFEMRAAKTQDAPESNGQTELYGLWEKLNEVGSVGWTCRILSVKQTTDKIVAHRNVVSRRPYESLNSTPSFSVRVTPLSRITRDARARARVLSRRRCAGAVFSFKLDLALKAACPEVRDRDPHGRAAAAPLLHLRVATRTVLRRQDFAGRNANAALAK